METPSPTVSSPPPLTAPPSADPLAHRLVIIMLGLTVLFAVIAMTILPCLGHECPPVLAHFAAVALGALSMLSRGAPASPAKLTCLALSALGLSAADSWLIH